MAAKPKAIPAAAEMAGALLGASAAALTVKADLGGVPAAVAPEIPGAFFAPAGAAADAPGATALKGAPTGNNASPGAIPGTTASA
jgi:hypothetical protein